MKGKWLTGALVLAMAAVTLAGCGAKVRTSKRKSGTRVTLLNEVAQCYCSTPVQYVAIVEEGQTLADEGIDLTLITICDYAQIKSRFGSDEFPARRISGLWGGGNRRVPRGTADPVGTSLFSTAQETLVREEYVITRFYLGEI
ncbi:MAG: hypothetical protein ACLSH1_06475 [Clostridia bacterium]